MRELDGLGQCEPAVADFSGALPIIYEAVKAVLQAHAPIRAEYFGPSYVFPDGMDPPPGVVALSPAQAPALQGPLERFGPRLSSDLPCMAIMVRDAVVSLAYTWRWTGRAAAVGVYTLEGYRERGYAAAVVAAWAYAVQRTGRLSFYGHAWDNGASNAVARRLGLRLIGDEVNIT